MTEAGIHLLLRYTARTTFLFFFLAFTGNALRDLFPGAVSGWLARRRDWLLLAMAASHTFHLMAIIALFETIGWAKLRLLTVVGGGLVYLLIYLLAANALIRLRTGGRGRPLIGTKLEIAALYLIWVVFAVAFVPRIISGWPVYSLLGLAALVALAIRITCLVRHRRAQAAGA
jgi:hypothetical protein